MLPRAEAVSAKRVTTEAFPGLDLRPRPRDGACAAMKNLWGGEYPVLSARPGRGLVTTLQAPGGLLAKDALLYADGENLCMNGYAVPLGLTTGPKTLVSMGAYAVVFPDKKYLNTQDLTDYGPLEHTVTTAGTVTFTLCDETGAAYTYLSADTAPDSPAAGAYWLSPDGPALLRYGESGWETVSCHVRIGATGVGAGFAAGDGVALSGGPSGLSGLCVAALAEADCLVVPGVCAAVSQTDPLTVTRTVPDLDYVVECGNRLWGCKYGLVDGKPVNELSCCKLGDFKNWHCYAGLSTDSWAASRGADGAFTGAATFQGSPIFFRETSLERVYPSAAGAHQVTTLQCAGVQRGCGGSLAVVGGALYYKSPDGVSRYDGALPVRVSDALGACRYRAAVGGALGADYYLSMQDPGGAPHLFLLDTARNFWYEQDALEVLSFAACNWELYGLCADGRLLSMTGVDGDGEEPVEFMLETADLGLDVPESKYLSRLRLRCNLGGSMTVSLQYDGDGIWHAAGRVESLGLRSFTLPILPRRCDHLRLRITGSGSFRLYSLSRLLEKGSDEG
ncbi:MAG: hypothetical protein VB055_03470 [Oscillospiraceae bacterium]|nr:hypothetical protein [Oscillospiraceae bacterium]